MNEPFRSSARTTRELLHAEVAYLMREADIPVLHIKGPTVAQWLYTDGERSWGDVDVLVPRELLHDALEVLRRAAFTERFEGVDELTSSDHAVTMARADQGLAGHGPEIDVHERFIGIELPADDAFELLWRRRVPATFAHIDAWAPDLPSRALLVALNTARSQNDQSREDLRRLVASADADDWRELVALAGRLQALPALRAGLSLLPEGEAIGREHLPGVEVSAEWWLRLDDPPRTALRLEELRHLPARQWPVVLAKWIAPPPAVVRMRDPRAADSRSALARAYVRRLGDGLRALPASVPALVRTRQARRDDVRNSRA